MTDKKWVPRKAPNLKAEFSEQSSPKHDILTKDELEKLLRERAKPQPTLDYRMDGTSRQEVNHEVNEEIRKKREDRIRTLMDGLGKAQEKTYQSFKIAADNRGYDKGQDR